jgi:hypothetical protein
MKEIMKALEQNDNNERRRNVNYKHQNYFTTYQKELKSEYSIQM